MCGVENIFQKRHHIKNKFYLRTTLFNQFKYPNFHNHQLLRNGANSWCHNIWCQYALRRITSYLLYVRTGFNPQKDKSTRITLALDWTIRNDKKANYFWNWSLVNQSQEYPDPIIPGSGNQFANQSFLFRLLYPQPIKMVHYMHLHILYNYDLRFTRCDMIAVNNIRPMKTYPEFSG